MHARAVRPEPSAVNTSDASLIDSRAVPLLTRVAVIINNHNYARYVGAAIDSALAQTYPGVAVVVVDDGSTDDSREVIASYGDRIVAVYKPNGGQGSAYNAGFAVADADLAIFLDADDMLLSDIVERVVDTAAAHPDAGKLQWRMEVVDANGRPQGLTTSTAHLPAPQGDMRRAELTFPFDIAWAESGANAYPAAVMRQLLPMPERGYHIGADTYMAHLSPLLGQVVALEAVGGLRRLHGRNAYEHAAEHELRLGRVRETIREAAVNRVQIARLADHLGLERRRGPILSVSDLAHRLISLRLDPLAHPLDGDRRWLLARDGVRAALRRFDVHPAMRAVFCAWFAAAALAPRGALRRLAGWFMFPSRRRAVNRLLGLLHRAHWGQRP